MNALKEVEMGCRACWEVIVTALREVEMGRRACWGGYFVSIKGSGKAFSL